MLDVHPPHEAAHSWKDFLIHMTTICLGLLIAIGLEQSVEWMHRRHERAQLQEDLRAELEQNQDLIRNDVAVLDGHMVWLTRWNAAAQDARDRKVPLTVTMTEYGFTQRVGRRFDLPSVAVWSVAEHAMTVGLLPRDQAEAFEKMSTVRERMVEGFQARVAVYRERTAFEARFADASAPTVPVCSKMSPEELNEYSALLMREYTAVRLEEMYQLMLFGVDRTLLDGRYDRSDLAEGMYSVEGELWTRPGSKHPTLDAR
ncbi:MAG: hypothetical protein WBY53_02545 [Acidobacteriaceae bacterium]